MSTNNDQSILNEALRMASESSDPKAEIGLVLLRYHQAMLRAAEHLRVCEACAATVDIPKLKEMARELQRGNYGNYQELQRLAKVQLGDTAKLCAVCRGAYKEQLLSIFVQLHRSSSNPG